ncbi:anti-sigma factor domain-containing protein [Paenibacillus alkaliterrae]|uniref:anti-sigma factor domain-containing protein n=1 Tax=Paenibacillus alkaliterrae TaxID=320909 RepID=UPI001F2B9245|nr:anti-sigma factor domain-containing protein [Paenibacillus alkaliterrae]MCF2938617.1 anti-sigma factor domain-containing protein [Paenibacillus alkaliterrae]
MKRGVVLSVHKQHAVVMTADGQFLRAPISGKAQIGEEITFEEEYKLIRTFKPVYWYSGAAAIILLLLPLLLFVQRDAHPVVAYLSMDINPSVEIGVDGEEKVRELRALNEDGELIIQGLLYEGVNVETVASSILERAKGSHYLDTPNKDIFITSVLLGNSEDLKLDYETILAKKVDDAIRGLLIELSADSASANVTTLSVPNEVRDAAAANGISAGKMVVYLMAKEEGYKLELEQMQQHSIDKATESIGGVMTIVKNAEDTSKEKLKELVAREQKEKKKEQKDDKKSDKAKPSSTPKVNKPVKAEKPERPDSNGADKAKKTDKPVTTSTPNDNKKGDKDRQNDRDRPDDDDDNDDNDDENDDDKRTDYNDDVRQDGRNDNDDDDDDNDDDENDDDDERNDDRDRQGDNDRDNKRSYDKKRDTDRGKDERDDGNDRDERKSRDN